MGLLEDLEKKPEAQEAAPVQLDIISIIQKRDEPEPKVSSTAYKPQFSSDPDAYSKGMGFNDPIFYYCKWMCDNCGALLETDDNLKESETKCRFCEEGKMRPSSLGVRKKRKVAIEEDGVVKAVREEAAPEVEKLPEIENVNDILNVIKERS
jgi:hypothetical protein